MRRPWIDQRSEIDRPRKRITAAMTDRFERLRRLFVEHLDAKQRSDVDTPAKATVGPQGLPRQVWNVKLRLKYRRFDPDAEGVDSEFWRTPLDQW